MKFNQFVCLTSVFLCINFNENSKIKCDKIIVIPEDYLLNNTEVHRITLTTFARKKECQSQSIRNCSKDSHKTIVLEGNMGSGKTTILNYVKNFTDIETFPEPIDKWTNVNNENFLELFYSDPAKYGFRFEHIVFDTVFENHVKKPVKYIKIMDRSLYSSIYVFSRVLYENGYISESELEELKTKFENLVNSGNLGDEIVLYIKTTPEVAFNRIKNRGRYEELAVDFDYIKKVHYFYEEFVRNTKLKVITINGDKALNEVLEEVRMIIEKLREEC